MATQTVYQTADCSRSTTVTNTKANASAFGLGSNDHVIFAGDNAYDNGSTAEYTGHFTDAYGAASGHNVLPRSYAVPGNHEYHTVDAADFRTFWSGTGQMPALPRGGFAHQRGNCRPPVVINGWTFIFLDTAGNAAGAYFAESQADVWISAYLADLDSWLAGVSGKAAIVVGHHMRYNPGGTGAHGNQAGVDAAWDRMWNTDGTPKISAWLGGHDHYLVATKPVTNAGGVASDDAHGVKFFCSGAGAGSFDTPGTQTIKDFGVGGLYGYLKLTIPDMIGGQPQPITAEFYTTGNNGQGADTLAYTTTIDPGTGSGGGGGLPSTTSGAATSVTDTTATLNGVVNPNGVATSYRFAYGLTSSYGSVTATTSAGSGSADVAVTANLTGLTAGTTYHYRLDAIQGGVVVASGADRTFITTGGTGGSDVLLDDSANRVVAPGGVGPADDGHTYTVTPATSWEANGDELVAHLLDVSPRTIIPQGIAQVASQEWIIQWNLGTPPSVAGTNVTGYFEVRRKDVSNKYRVRVVGNTNDAVTTAIQRVVGGLATQLGSVITSEPNGSILGGRNFQTRLRITGGDTPRLQARSWIAANVEPTAWDVDVTDTDPAAILGVGGIASVWVASLAPTNAIGAHIDNWTLTSLEAAVAAPQVPVLTGVPSNGQTTASSVSVSFVSPTPPAVSAYEKSYDSGLTWATQASPETVSLPTVGTTKNLWVRAIGADGQRSPIATATITRVSAGGGTNSPNYTPVSGDNGYQIRGRVTPQNAAGSGSTVTTPWSPAVGSAVALPANTTAPLISGGDTIGDTLQLDEGVWTGSPTGYDYQWLSDGVVVGSNNPVYTIQNNDSGNVITARVRARNAAGTSGYTDASNSVIVSSVLTTPVLVSPGFISAPGGDANVGEVLTVDEGEYTGTPPITFTYQWYRGSTATGPWVPIAGATQRSFLVPPTDVGLFYAVDVVPHNPAQP